MTRSSPHRHGDAPLPVPPATCVEGLDTGAPDFFYREAGAAICVDGSPHDTPDQVREDEARSHALREVGYIVIRFHHEADWPAVIRLHPALFCTLNER